MFRSVFGSRPSGLFDVLQFQCSPPLIKHEEDTPAKHPLAYSNLPVAMKGVIRRVTVVDWPKQVIARRHQALLRWRLIVEEQLDSTNLGKQLQEAALGMKTDQYMQEMIEYAFADRATSTLTKRGTSLLKYLIWHRKAYGISGLPLLEKRVYEFMVEQKEAKCAPTSMSCFLSAVGFSKFVLDLQGSVEVLQSARIRGIAHSLYLTKRPLKQAKVFTAEQVKILEDLTRCALEPSDRVAAGFFCACLHTRACFSDLQFASIILCEGIGYLEFGSCQVKTSKTKEAKTTLMPLVAPTLGLLSTPWAPVWIREREQQNLPCQACSFVLPMLGSNGAWLDAPMDSRSATAWLKALLMGVGQTLEQVADLSTHSCKSTPLAWSARFGLSIETRQMLGHHVTADKVSALTYSRDAQALPLREYEKVLAAIRLGEFFPDSTRSGVFKKPKTSGPQPYDIDASGDYQVVVIEDGASVQPLECIVVHEHQGPEAPSEAREVDSDSGSDSSSSSSEESVDVEAQQVLAKRKCGDAVIPRGSKLYICVRSGLLHASKTEDAESKLWCGKSITASYRAKPPGKSTTDLRCIPCFSKMLEA